MIVHKIWKEDKSKSKYSAKWYQCEGYYLFGFILIYKKEFPINN